MTRRYHLSPPLLLFALLAFVVALIAMNGQNNLLFWMFGAMVAALFVSGIVSGFMMIGLTVHRLDPGHGAVGEPLVVRYRVENRSRWWPAFNVHVEDLAAPPERWWRQAFAWIRALPAGRLELGTAAAIARRERWRRSPASFWRLMPPARAWVMHVGPGEMAHGEAVFWPAQRGEATFEWVRLWTTFPFGLVRKSITFPRPARTLVFPRRHRLRPDVLDAVTPAGPVGMQVTPAAGSGHDYFGLREYRPGDSLRRISWKRTAGRDEIVCIEHAASSPPKLRVALDLTQPSPTEPAAARVARDQAERAIELAASLIDAADDAGYEVGLTVLGLRADPLPVRHGHWHRARLLAALAAIDLDAPRHRPSATLLRDLEPVALVVVHPDRVDPSIGRGETWHLTGRQLESLAAGPVGRDPRANAASSGAQPRVGSPKSNVERRAARA